MVQIFYFTSVIATLILLLAVPRSVVAKPRLMDILTDIEMEETASFGTLIRCEGGQQTRCLWSGRDGKLVSADTMMRQLMMSEGLSMEHDHSERRRLAEHMRYLEELDIHSRIMGLKFTYRMGVNVRHLYLANDRALEPFDFVQQELQAHTRRRLEQASTAKQPRSRELANMPTSLNWCSDDNPLKKNICTTVKSQNKCGSCWAFAATDAIETAVAVVTKKDPLALSPQQFLDCSKREMTSTFQYCWAEGGVKGASWLQTEMKWASANNGCDGGMTHGAFADAAQLHLALMSQLDLPYTETESDISIGFSGVKTTTLAPKSDAEKNLSCVQHPEKAAASITGWEQAVGKDCGLTRDPTQLLKTALQQQPVSVAINSGSAFKDYKGGIYVCPNNGDFVDSRKVDHALLLVGYGNDGTTDYWLLKNSYSSQWGDKGFLKLQMDSKINCGINIFPVIPTGAQPGAAKPSVDGGGDTIFVGFSPTAWIAIATLVSIVTTVLTVAGVLVQRRRRNALRETLG